MIKKYNWWKIIILFFCFFTIFLVQRQNLLKPIFVDEQDNFVVAKNLINGNKIYTNIFSHHQPGTYILSGIIQKITNPNTIEMLIQYHRQFIILWSILWIVFILCRFGFQMLGPMIAIELVKNIYLGSLFLAESLVFAPMIYLVLSFLENKFSKKEAFFWGLIASIVGITLAPMWPVLALMILTFCWRYRKKTKNIELMIGGGVLILIITFCFINIKGYFENAILINQKYYIPFAGGDNLIRSIIKSITTPFLYLKDGLNSPESLLIKFFILIFFILIFFLFKEKKWQKIFWILLLLSLTNLRNFELQKIYYDGFHILIWVGLVMTTPFYWLKKKWWILGLLPVIFMISLNRETILNKSNTRQDFEIYYSRIFNMSEAIRTTKNNNDRLLTIPGEVLGYWQAEIKPAGRFIFFYKWMAGVEQLKNEELETFQTKPEYLIFGGDEGLSLTEILKNYKNFSYRGSESSEFFIRNDIYKNFSKEKIDKLKYYGLEVI
ncbi:MAG: hypothetical protein PHP97_02075 [Candidatus Shapirobacteria bacterium]|nr:hypothetical protein [Candidatus Shapirobacteria bacterium]MDD3002732.1 hypothetical protein [Candidatus Shapirobacteria bacterium]MDD4382921.1 hypothetical protein [Candidatus Shapirobacteria bacterium]